MKKKKTMSKKSTLNKLWFVYMIISEKGPIYTGITTDLERRFMEHWSGKKGAKFFNISLPEGISYYETYPSRSLATKREIELKKLKRIEKIHLIKSFKKSSFNF